MLCPKVYRQRKNTPKSLQTFWGASRNFFVFFIEKIQLIRISLEKAIFGDFCKKANHPKFLNFRWFFVVAGVGFEPHDLRVMRGSYKPSFKIERVDETCTVGLLTTIMSTNLKSKFASSSIARKQK